MEARRFRFACRVVKHLAVFDARKRGTRVNGQRLPWLHAEFELLWKDFGIAGRLECFLRDFAGDLMLAVTVAHRADKRRQHDLRANHAHGKHGVVEHAIVAPLGERLFLRLRKSEIGFGAPQLANAVVLVGLQQLLRANESEGIVALGRHGVLAAFAARKREQRYARAESARKVGEQRAIFVIGMGHNGQHACRGAQPLQRLFQVGGTAIFRQRQCVGRRLGQRHLRQFAGERLRCRFLCGERTGMSGHQKANEYRAKCCWMQMPREELH